MINLTRVIVAIRGWWAGRAFEKGVRNPRAAQERFLKRLLKENAQTAFGRDHDFVGVETFEDFRARVPMRNYEGHKVYIDRMIDDSVSP